MFDKITTTPKSISNASKYVVNIQEPSNYGVLTPIKITNLNKKKITEGIDSSSFRLSFYNATRTSNIMTNANTNFSENETA
jgi:hypothetical protein